MDSLAIAIGTSHGAYKFKPTVHRNERHLIRRRCASTFWRKSPSVCPASPSCCTAPPPSSAGICRDDQPVRRQDARRRRHSRGACCVRLPAWRVCKINIDSDLRLAMTGCHPQVLRGASGSLRPPPVPQAGRTAIKEMVRHKLLNVLGCNGKAEQSTIERKRGSESLPLFSWSHFSSFFLR